MGFDKARALQEVFEGCWKFQRLCWCLEMMLLTAAEMLNPSVSSALLFDPTLLHNGPTPPAVAAAAKFFQWSSSLSDQNPLLSTPLILPSLLIKATKSKPKKRSQPTQHTLLLDYSRITIHSLYKTSTLFK
jgi:hypothetical protein